MHASERCSSSEMRREENKQTSHDTAERRGRERCGGEGARHSGAPWTGARAGRVAPHRPGRLARAGRSLRERISRQPTSGTDKNISRSRPVPSRPPLLPHTWRWRAAGAAATHGCCSRRGVRSRAHALPFRTAHWFSVTPNRFF